MRAVSQRVQHKVQPRRSPHHPNQSPPPPTSLASDPGLLLASPLGSPGAAVLEDHQLGDQDHLHAAATLPDAEHLHGGVPAADGVQPARELHLRERRVLLFPKLE